MKTYWNSESHTMHLHEMDAKGFPFILSIHHKDDNSTVSCVSLERPGCALPNGNVIGPVGMSFRVLCWGDIFYRLTRGVEIPKNWFSHNEA